MIKRISITGPESTGKTQLTTELARHYHADWVPEYAVTYLEANGPEYTEKDLLAIAKGQLQLEQDTAKQSSGLLFCDTDLLVIHIWNKVVFNKPLDWAVTKLKEEPHELYLLTYPDLKWEDAPFRENPDDRDYLFGLYEKELMTMGFNYRVVRGCGKERLENAITFVEETLKH